MYMIVGLGNPGPEYAKTHHNVGFMAIEAIKKAGSFPLLDRSKLQARLCKGKLNGEEVLLVRPMTYMNNSGAAVRAVMDFYKITPDHVVIIYDDIDLETGAVRIREKGSAGSHNGMKSVVSHLNTTEFPRIRIGVGGKPEGWDLVDYVLSRFSPEDQVRIDEAVKTVTEACKTIVKGGVDIAMNRYNTRKKGNA